MIRRYRLKLVIILTLPTQPHFAAQYRGGCGLPAAAAAAQASASDHAELQVGMGNARR